MPTDSGLSAKDEKALALILLQLEALTGARAYMGGQELDALSSLQVDVRRRLEPESVESLKERAAIVENWRTAHEWAARYLKEAGL